MALYLNPRAKRRRRLAEETTPGSVTPEDEENRVEETLEEKRLRESV